MGKMGTIIMNKVYHKCSVPLEVYLRFFDNSWFIINIVIIVIVYCRCVQWLAVRGRCRHLPAAGCSWSAMTS